MGLALVIAYYGKGHQMLKSHLLGQPFPKQDSAQQKSEEARWIKYQDSCTAERCKTASGDQGSKRSDAIKQAAPGFCRGTNSLQEEQQQPQGRSLPSGRRKGLRCLRT